MNTTCPTVCPVGTTTGTARGTDGVPCWVQNQNQNQTVIKYRFWSFWLTSNSKLRSVTREPWARLGLGQKR